MTNFDINKFIKKAIKYAKTFGEANDSEDFSQEAIIQILSGRKTSIKNLFIDYVRSKYGSKKSNFHTLRTNLKKRPFEFNDLMYYMTRDHNRWLNEEKINDLANLLIDRETRSIFILKVLWGFELKEIAYCLGVSESWISFQMKNIERKLTKYSQTQRLNYE